MSSNQQSDIKAIVEMAEATRQQNGWVRSSEILREGLQKYPDSVLLMAHLGKALRFCGGFAEAEQILRQAQSLDSNNYDVLYQLGIILRREAKIWDALVVHSHLVEKFPEDANALHVLANDQTILGRPDKALPILEQLISQFPERVNYRVSYSDALNRMGRYTEAITVANEVLAKNSYFIDALIALAEANFGLMRTSEWIASARKAYNFNSNSAVVNLWMHYVCLEAAKLEEAFEFLRQSLTIHPRFFQAHIAMGSFYWKAEREDLAQQWFESAYEIAPWSGEAQGMLAQFMAETGREEPNFQELENQALALPYARLPYYLGRMFLGTYQNYNRALQFLKIAVEYAPENVDTRKLLGETYIFLQEYDKAIEQLECVVNLCPELTKAWEELAYTYLQTNRLSEAASAYSTVIQHLPNSANIRHGYGITLVHLGEVEKGIAELQQATQLEPNDENILLSLAQALELAERYSEATEAALKAQALQPEDEQELLELLERLSTQ